MVAAFLLTSGPGKPSAEVPAALLDLNSWLQAPSCGLLWCQAYCCLKRSLEKCDSKSHICGQSVLRYYSCYRPLFRNLTFFQQVTFLRPQEIQSVLSGRSQGIGTWRGRCSSCIQYAANELDIILKRWEGGTKVSNNEEIPWGMFHLAEQEQAIKWTRKIVQPQSRVTTAVKIRYCNTCALKLGIVTHVR